MGEASPVRSGAESGIGGLMGGSRVFSPGKEEGKGNMKRSPKILIVDDDPDFIEIGRLSLEGKGYEILSASSGREGWELVQRESPDLVILDLMMEDLDAGMTLSHKIKTDPRHAGTPILMLTSIARETGMDFTPRTEEDLRKLRVDDYHSKPIKVRTLLEKVDKLLARREDPGSG